MRYIAVMSEEVEQSPEFVLPGGAGRIVATTGVCGGRPRIRGTRMTVSILLAGLAAGDTIEGIVEDYPFISREDILAALNYAAVSLESPVADAA